MKYVYLALIAAVLTGCHSKYVEINGTVKGFNSGNFVVEDAAGHIKFTGSIEDGKFHTKRMMDTPGFYELKLVQDGYKDIRRPLYTVYLEPGNYNISVSADSVFQYPNIQSSSTNQTELSQYYAIANKKTADLALQLEKYEDDIYSGNSATNATDDEKDKLNAAMEERDKRKAAALLEYVGKYPQNHIEAHIMYMMNYGGDGATFSPIYQKFSAEQKKTDEGTEEGAKLGALDNLQAGKTAPQIVGNTPDGKPFSPKSITKKVVLVEFWRAGDETAKDIHSKLIGDSFSPLKTGDFTVVSVSLDNDATAWKNAVKDGGLSWTQVSDLKGADSPNVTNWQISKIPTYFLIDGKTWKIIKASENYLDLASDVDDYIHSGKVK